MSHVSEPASEPPDSTPERRPASGGRTAVDMLRSLGFLLLIIAVLWGLWSLNNDPQVHEPEPVAYRGALQAAREAADYRVLGPRDLPEGWMATSVERTQDGGYLRWHLGLLTDDQEYVGIEQYDGPPDDFAAEYVAGLQPGDVLTINDRRWRLYLSEGSDSDSALVSQGGDATTIVVGTASPDTLIEFTGELS
ncbi:MAG: DUF4245 family protein [Propionibacteriales bacterium]|nr:DUF4245 family protein [Propionibacteriales bacterium]